MMSRHAIACRSELGAWETERESQSVFSWMSTHTDHGIWASELQYKTYRLHVYALRSNLSSSRGRRRDDGKRKRRAFHQFRPASRLTSEWDGP